MKKKEDDNRMKLKQVIKQFGGNKAFLMPISLLVSGIGAVAGVLPYYFIWKLISELILHFGDVDQKKIFNLAIIIVASQIVSILLNISAGLISHAIAFRVESNIRRQSVQHILRLPLGYFDRNETGRIRKIIDDNASLTHSFLAHMLPDLANVIVTPITLLALLLTVDIRFFWLCLGGFVVAGVAMSIMMTKEGKNFMVQYMKSLENLNSEGVEYVRGIPVVKVFNQSVRSFKRFYSAIMEYDKYATGFVIYCRKGMLLYALAFHLVTMLIGPLCLALIKGSSDPVGIFINAIFYIIISLLFNTTIMKTLTISETINQFEISVGKIKEILNEKTVEIKDVPKKDEEGIVFDNVRFSYSGSDRNVLDGIDLKFEKGKIYALVGLSGSGKTTLISLISRFYDVTEGAIRIDGRDVRSIPEAELSQKVALVMQENAILKDTLYENITMKDKSKSREEVMRAISESGSEDIVEKLSDGIDTKLGVKGSYLSGGEIQRMAIARAFLKDSSILLLDEATAYADPENEHKIRKAFESLKKDKTTIMIAHRLNTIRDVDEIIVIDNGKIAAKGSHDDLIVNSPEYKKLYEEFAKSIEWRVDND